MAEGNLGGQRFQVIAFVDPCGRLPQVAIEHGDTLGMPAQALRAPDEGALRELTVEMLTHLLGARLADVDHRLAFEMPEGEFHWAQVEIWGHGASPHVVMGLGGEPPTVARRRAESFGRAVAGRRIGVATADGAQSGCRAGAAAPHGREGLASLLTPCVAWWMS